MLDSPAPSTHCFENQELGYSAWICVHSLRNGLSFGGCRFDLSVTRKIVEDLAQCMTWKLAPHGLPVGGAKGGVCVSSTSENLPRILEDFGRKASSILKSTTVLGKDLGATDSIMDSIYRHAGIPQMFPVKSRPGHNAVPDKLREMSGYQKHMTGLGVSVATEAAIGAQHISGKRVLIQGAGAVGLGTAYRLSALGCKIVGISDKLNSVYNKNGLSFDVIESNISAGLLEVANFASSEINAPDELLSREADILVLAATSNCLDEAIARKIQSEVIVEGANFPLLPGARQVLHSQGQIVVPDIVANSSSAAMVAHQMASGNAYSHSELWQRITRSISSTVEKILAISKVEGIQPRDAFIEILVPELLQPTSKAA